MTQVQARAIACRLTYPRVLSELTRSPFRLGLKRGRAASDIEIRKWLLNSWNTEALLRIILSTFPAPQLRRALHWAFPKAYYSTYASCLAFFKAVGYTESSHMAVIRKFGMEVATGHYPLAVSFLCDGGKVKSYQNLHCTPLPTTLYFDPYDAGIIDERIRQFLGATRNIDLAEKRVSMPFKTARGAKKCRLTPADWERVSSALGLTSLLSLLYRKRIKSNYRDIDTYFSDQLDPTQVYADLVHLTSTLNLVHETYISAALGFESYRRIAECANDPDHRFVLDRLAEIHGIEA